MAVTISLAVTQNSQSVTDNTSNVTVKATVKWTGGSHNATGECYGSLTIDGTKYSFTGLKFNTGKTTSGSQVIMTKTVNVKHDTIGEKTLSCSASFYTGVSSGTVVASAKRVLTTISRKSTLSASNGTLGTAQTLTINRNSSSFTHTIKYTCGNASGTVAANTTGTSISFTPPLSLASQNTTGTSVSVKLEIITISDGTNRGTNTKTITCSIPSSVKPSCSISVSDAAGYSVYVKGYSKFKITVNPTLAYGSEIASYSVKANGATYETASVTTSVLASSGTLTITATVKDKRGRTGTATKTVTVYDKSTLSTVNGTLGVQQALQISSGYSGFKHTITYSCGNASGTVVTKTSEKVNIPFTPPESLASQNTTGTSLSVKLTITTYCDDKSIGSNTATITCSIPSHIAPSVSFRIEDPTGFESTFYGMVKGQSRLNIHVDFTPAYDSNIVSIYTNVSGVKYNKTSINPDSRSETIDAGLVSTASDISISTTVTDARGRTATVTGKVTGILNYSAPTISKLNVARCNENGTANSEGDFVKVTVSASVHPLNNLNSGVYKLRYKKATETSFPASNLKTFGNDCTITNQTHIFPADTGSSYVVELSATDTFTTTVKSTTVSTAFTIIHFHKDGRGVAIGKVSEDKFKSYVDVALPLLMRNNTYICGLTTDGAANHMLYTNANNNTIVGYGGYILGYGTTNIYGNQLNFGVRAGGIGSENTVFYKPYYESGDNFSELIYTSGYLTQDATSVFFVIPLSKPVIGSPTMSVTSGRGFVLRQNGSYTHGSASGSFIVPSSYSCWLLDCNTIQVKAEFENITNATNNDTIAVQWEGAIYFN